MKNNFLKSVAVLFAIVFLSMANFNNHLMAQFEPIPVDDNLIIDVSSMEELRNSLGSQAHLLDGINEGWLSAYQLIRYDDQQPSQGPWKSQKPLTEYITIGNCKFKIEALWRCRVGFDGIPEIQILKLEVYAESKECKKLIPKYRAQIIDRMIFRMFSFNDYATPKEKELMCCFCGPTDGLNHIRPCGDGYTPVFRVYVSQCGNNITFRYDKYDFTIYIPCKTVTFCRIKYRYCYYMENGDMKIRVEVDPERYDDYGCPPYEVYYDNNGKLWEVTCKDSECGIRKRGYYPFDPKPILDFEDINGNPPYFVGE